MTTKEELKKIFFKNTIEINSLLKSIGLEDKKIYRESEVNLIKSYIEKIELLQKKKISNA